MRIRRRLTSAHVISLVALFVALGGTGYAALSLPTNSVKAKQIAKDAVRSGEVKNGALKSGDAAPGQVPQGAAGPAGPAGAAGAPGEPGARGQFGQVIVETTLATADLADGLSQSYNAFCPEGYIGINGGARGDFEDSEAANIGSSRPARSPSNTEPPLDGGTFTGWRITVQNRPGGLTTGIRPEVWVACAKPVG